MPEDKQQDGRSIQRTVTLFEEHVTAVETLARRERRTFSNALQRIIELWTEQNSKEQHA